jgi:hypothetical protein
LSEGAPPIVNDITIKRKLDALVERFVGPDLQHLLGRHVTVGCANQEFAQNPQ